MAVSTPDLEISSASAMFIQEPASFIRRQGVLKPNTAGPALYGPSAFAVALRGVRVFSALSKHSVWGWGWGWEVHLSICPAGSWGGREEMRHCRGGFCGILPRVLRC